MDGRGALAFTLSQRFLSLAASTEEDAKRDAAEYEKTVDMLQMRSSKSPTKLPQNKTPQV